MESSSHKAIDRRIGDVWLLLIPAFVALMIFVSADLCAASGSNVGFTNRLKLSGTIKDALGRPIADAEIRLEEGGR
jgi:hypothetical protein